MTGLTVLPIERPGPPSMIGPLQRRDVPYGVELELFVVDALRAELSAIGISRQSRAGADG